MTIAREMEGRLRQGLRPRTLEILDESERHRGHAGWREGGETHFRVRISAPELDGLSRLERHRKVHSTLGADLIGRIHALAIEIE